MNSPIIQNTPSSQNEASLEAALAKQLEAIIGDVPWLRNWKVKQQAVSRDVGWDISASIPLPNGNTAELLVECKAEPRPSLFSTIVERRFDKSGAVHSAIPVLAAPFIGPRMAEVCWSRNWSWFDLAGNCRINVPDAFYIERTGRERLGPAPKPMVNLSRWESARILRVLLAPDNAGIAWTQRLLLNHMGSQPNGLPGASTGLINKVIRSLRDDQFVEEQAKGGFKLKDPIGLLAAWREAYRFDKHRRRGYFTLLQGRQLHEALARFESHTGGHVAYAVYSAAAIQAPNVRQPKTWLYVGSQFEEQFRSIVEAKPVDSGENLVVLFPADDHVFYLQEAEGDGLPCTNPVQTCIDLYKVGGRGEEAAQSILEQKLKPAWHLAGIL